MHPTLREILEEATASSQALASMTLVAGQKGRPYTSNGFDFAYRQAKVNAGEPDPGRTVLNHPQVSIETTCVPVRI